MRIVEKTRQMVALAFGVLVLMAGCSEPSQQLGQAEQAASQLRVVSLSPGLTETLAELDAQNLLVGRSDYCVKPKSACELPAAGTALTPNYEALANLSPDLILFEAYAGTPVKELEQIAPTLHFPWLTVADVHAGIVALGERIGKTAQSTQLANDLTQVLDVAPPADAPTALMLIGAEAYDGEWWFIRKNSLHGAVLHAAGARHAINEDIQGNAALSLERLLMLDPEILIILTSDRGDGDADKDAMQAFALEGIRHLDELQAVQEGKIIVLREEAMMVTGPGVLKLVPKLRTQIETVMGVN